MLEKWGMGLTSEFLIFYSRLSPFRNISYLRAIWDTEVNRLPPNSFGLSYGAKPRLLQAVVRRTHLTFSMEVQAVSDRLPSPAIRADDFAQCAVLSATAPVGTKMALLLLVLSLGQPIAAIAVPRSMATLAAPLVVGPDEPERAAHLVPASQSLDDGTILSMNYALAKIAGNLGHVCSSLSMGSNGSLKLLLVDAPNAALLPRSNLSLPD